jgi:predicted alpha/beta hydrolase family esterase
VVNYIPPGLEIGMSEDFYRQRLKKANVKDTLAEIDEIVERYGGKVLFATHSFGCFMSSMYIHHYPHKVVGLIEIGGLPLRAYGLMKLVLKTEAFGNDNPDVDAII